MQRHLLTTLNELQKISTSASSESAIRSALNELELWFAGARLAVTYYSDKAQQPTPVVRDFTEILGKVSHSENIRQSKSVRRKELHASASIEFAIRSDLR